MSPPRTRRPEAGFTLYELVVAVLLLGIAVHPLLGTLASQVHVATDRQRRLGAERALRNEVAILRVADPDAVGAGRAYRTDGAGRATAAGPFHVRTRREVRCGVGGAPADNAAAPATLGCSAGGVVVDYTVVVTFPRAAGAGDTGSLTHAFSVAASAPRGTGIGAMP